MSIEHAKLVVERTYPAARARVFAAWAEPRRKARWFCGPDARYELDFQVGGTEVNRDGTPGGLGYTYVARYSDIVTDERIVFTYELFAGQALASVSLTTVALAPAGDGTTLTLTEQIAVLDGLDTASARERGLGTLLDRLGGLLADGTG